MLPNKKKIRFSRKRILKIAKTNKQTKKQKTKTKTKNCRRFCKTIGSNNHFTSAKTILGFRNIKVWIYGYKIL